MKLIEIPDFKEVQKQQELCDIPFTASITRWMVEVMNHYRTEGHDVVMLRFDPSVLPEAYRRVPQMWVQQTKHRVEFEHLHGFKDGNDIVLRGSNDPYIPNFIRRVTDGLRTKGQIELEETEIPPSYRFQPYNLICKLKNRGFTKILRRVVNTKTILTLPKNERAKIKAVV